MGLQERFFRCQNREYIQIIRKSGCSARAVPPLRRVPRTKGDIHVEICSACHPFFTGKQKLVDTAGRVERFRRKYAKSDAGKSDAAKAPAAR